MKKTVLRVNQFSLIELLIVISIISILASLLLPALNKAKQTAQKIACLNNQSSLGKAANMYQDDNQGYLISYYNTGWGSPSYEGPGCSYKSGCLTALGGGKNTGAFASYLNIDDSLDIGAYRWGNGDPSGPLRRSRFACPSSGNFSAPDAKIHNTIGYSISVSTYSRLKVSNFRNISRTLLFGDRPPDIETFHLSHTLDSAKISRTAFPHQQSGVFVMTDGHAETIRRNDRRMGVDLSLYPGCEKNPAWHTGINSCILGN